MMHLPGGLVAIDRGHQLRDVPGLPLESGGKQAGRRPAYLTSRGDL